MLSLSFAQDSDLGWYISFVTMRELSVADSKDTDWAATTGVGLLKVNIMFFRLFFWVSVVNLLTGSRIPRLNNT